MRIAFIYPATQFDKDHHFEALPIGVLYLTSVIEKKYGDRVDIYDSRHGSALPGPSILNDYDVIGFTAMSMQVNHSLKQAAKLRDNGFRGKIVYGGPHASVASDHLKNQSFIDAVFIGEAEISFLKYLAYLEGRSQSLERIWIRDEVKGWNFYSGNHYINDLDGLPFPSRDKYKNLVLSSRMINMTTTRGCPFHCNYCQPTKRILFGNSIRRRSVGNIIEEIEDSTHRYNINRFSIDDDTFTFDKNIVLEFCRRVKKFGYEWSCQSRSDIDKETLEYMKDSGCSLIYVGAESGSQRVLDLMNKKNTVERNTKFIKACNEIGIKTWCNMMVGYPGETVEDMKKSLQFVMDTRPSRVCVSQVTPFPGTNLWENHKSDLMTKDWDDIARHIQKAKFKSLASVQNTISYYIIAMTKDFNHPLNYEIIASSRILSTFKYALPFITRFQSIIPFLRMIKNLLGKRFFKKNRL